jgi:hypothetical protein
MDRYVIVESIEGDRARIERRIAGAGFTLITPMGPDQGVALLAHPTFARGVDPTEALTMVRILKRSLDITAQYVRHPVGTFEFRRALRINDDGTHTQEAMAALVGQTIVTGQCDFVVGRANDSEEQRQLREAEEERLRREAEEQGDARAGRLMKEVVERSVVREVLEAVNDSQATPLALWAIYEKVKLAVGGEAHVATLINSNRTEVLRFWNTINDPRELGDAARHGATIKRRRVTNPMTLAEAREFALRIGRRWLDGLAG